MHLPPLLAALAFAANVSAQSVSVPQVLPSDHEIARATLDSWSVPTEQIQAIRAQAREVQRLQRIVAAEEQAIGATLGGSRLLSAQAQFDAADSSSEAKEALSEAVSSFQTARRALLASLTADIDREIAAANEEGVRIATPDLAYQHFKKLLRLRESKQREEELYEQVIEEALRQ